MIKVKSTSLDFGKMDREPIDLLIANGCEFESVQVDANSEEQGIAVVKDADVLVVGLQRITKRVLDAAGRLKVIGRCGVGLDNIDLKAAGSRGIPVVYTPGANAQTVADLTLGLFLALARKINQADRMTRGHEWKRIMGNDVWGKTLGIFGLGQIGANVARRAKGFDMKVVAYDVVQNVPLARELGIEFRTKADILGMADFITLHLPLNPETRGFIGERRIERHEKNRDPGQYLPRRDRRREGTLSGLEGGSDRRRGPRCLRTGAAGENPAGGAG